MDDADPCAEPRRFKLGRAIFWAVTWAVGAALGTALGAWLTLAGQSGVPGGELDPGTEFVRLPLLALAGVFVVHLGAQLAAEAWRSWRCRDDERRTPDRDVRRQSDL